MQAAKTMSAALLCLCGSTAHAEATAHIGFLSDYVFRGVFQADSVANGGIDFGANGFYIGSWTADVGQGLEVDLYGGYGGKVSELSYTVGYTGYFYTDDFDDTYQEINLTAGYGLFSLQYNVGEYDNFGGPKLDYTYGAMGADYGGFHVLFGFFGEDFAGEYVDVGYGAEVAGFDLGMSVIYSDAELAGGDSSESTLVFSISRTFRLGGAAGD